MERDKKTCLTAGTRTQDQTSAGEGRTLVHESERTVRQILVAEVEAADLLGVSRRKFQELRQESWMPKPRVLGPRLLRWVRSELEQAVISIPQQEQPSSEPERLRRARIARMKGGASS
jgi:predicted DNA-binding transcriptional regulator AlpA